jgi:hypothetical protein
MGRAAYRKHAPIVGASTMISRVDLRITRSFEGARYFGGSAAGATRLRLPSDPLPLALNQRRRPYRGSALGCPMSWPTQQRRYTLPLQPLCRRSVLSRRRGHTAEASRRVFTFSGELLAPGSGPSPHRTVQFRTPVAGDNAAGGFLQVVGLSSTVAARLRRRPARSAASRCSSLQIGLRPT